MSGATIFEQQLRRYELEKRAGRVKVACSLQLLSSCCYVLASPLPAGHGVGFLCMIAALINFSAAQLIRRTLLLLACGMSVTVAIVVTGFVLRLLDVLRNHDTGSSSIQRLLTIFLVLSASLVLLQAWMLSLCRSLLRLSAAERGPIDPELSIMVDGAVEDLAHVDLAKTPPERPESLERMGDWVSDPDSEVSLTHADTNGDKTM